MQQQRRVEKARAATKAVAVRIMVLDLVPHRLE